ncbi:hypothetical protein [Polynucleobacter sp. UK-Gri1-W3]|uniref:hypothetical protein n=1 Tax=Polynucleobacter sp. UK-Gri1-W3 TaxID=1819737 RepID=UPI001C0B4578|nr:hypothetical protein [Polynucleobacter sp. UK-Gri1-W3]MBU3537640.1 hypothetical protein [Polynucleobacter sp. UK-Gri1-W3]
MATKQSLYDKALDIMQSNESLYDRWENAIAAHMAKEWANAFAVVAKISGSDSPTVMEVADMGSDEIQDNAKFLSDLQEVFKTLAKGCQLDNEGNWI